MKKSISIFLLLTVFAFAAGGCADKKVTRQGRALVTVDNTYLIVIDGGPIVMHNLSDDENIFDGVGSGDLIEIKCDSEILESYPGQMNVYSCKVIESGALQDVSADAVSGLQAMNWMFKE